MSDICWLCSVHQVFWGRVYRTCLVQFQIGLVWVTSRLFLPRFVRLSSDSFFVCYIGFVVSHCVPREHPPNHLCHGHHGVWFACLAVSLRQWSKSFVKVVLTGHVLCSFRTGLVWVTSVLFLPWFVRLCSDSFFVYCVGFVVSCCVPREHPSNHLGHGYYSVWFACLVVSLGQWSKSFERNLWLSFTPSGCCFWSFR